MNTQIENSPVTSNPFFNVQKRDTAFAVCAIIASVFTSVFGFFGGFALGYLLSVSFMLILFTFYFAKKATFNFYNIITGLLALSNGAVFITTTNSGVRFFAVIISFLLGLMFIGGLNYGKVKGNRQTVGIFYSAASSIAKIDVAIKSLFAGGENKKKNLGKALIGLLCALPVLLVVVPLLISSDEAFSGMMKSLFANTFTTILKAAFGVAISVFVISYGFCLKFKSTATIKKTKSKGIENVYLISFLSAIAFCYFLYLFSQLAYFFSAFKGFLPNGEITYAQYARKGFFEMCAIAVINLLIIFIALLIAKKRQGKPCHAVKALATFICIFTLIIISTAISKMVLYIDAYGMTVKRLTTSAFMLFLAVVFIAVALKIYIRKINIIKTALLSAGITVLLLGTLNVNTICARYNYQSYISNKLETIDIDAMHNLGDEGVPYLIKLTTVPDYATSENAKNYIIDCYVYYYFENMTSNPDFSVKNLKKNQKDFGFANYSIPKATAYRELYDFIEKNPDFAEECHERFSKSDEEIPDSYYDYSEQTYY